MDLLKKCILMLFLILPAALFAAGQAVNINTADKQTLMTVKGVGERRADAIIQYRQKHGPFKSVDQLTQINGIGRSLIEANRDTLSVKDDK